MWVRDEEQVTNLAATYGYRVLKKHKYGKVYQKGTIKVIPNHTPKRSVAIIIKSQSPTQQFQFYVTDQMIVGIFKRPHAFHRTGYKDFAEYQNSMARKRTYDMMVNTNHNGTHPPQKRLKTNCNTYASRNHNQPLATSNTFLWMPNRELRQFTQNMWSRVMDPFIEQNKQALVNAPKYTSFIQRNKVLILEELFAATQEFQADIHAHCMQYQNNANVFNLSLHPRRNTPHQYLVKFTKAYKAQNIANGEPWRNNIHRLSSADPSTKCTFVCKCVINTRNVVELIQKRKERCYVMNGEYLTARDSNDDRDDDTAAEETKNEKRKTKDYLMVKIQPMMIVNDKGKIIRMDIDVKHATQCDWIVTNNYPLILYQYQLKYCRQFVSKAFRDEMQWGQSLSPVQSLILNKGLKEDRIRDTLRIHQTEYDMMKDKVREYTHRTNQSQKESIIKGMLSPLSLIHGPPGTGKTSTCANLVKVILNLKHPLKQPHDTSQNKIFVCAYTNLAANTLLRTIATACAPYRNRILRLGDMDKVPRDLRQYCFGMKMMDTVQETFGDALVVIGTVYSAASRSLRRYIKEAKEHNPTMNPFSYVLIDEVTQILEPVLTIPITLLHNNDHDRLILIGDPQQLSAVIKSRADIKHDVKLDIFSCVLNDLNASDSTAIFEYEAQFEQKLFVGFIRRIENQLKPRVIVQDVVSLVYQYMPKADQYPSWYSFLNIQYRMPQPLIEFSNASFYNHRIKSNQMYVDPYDAQTAQIFALMDQMQYETNHMDSIEVSYCHPIPIAVVCLKDATPKRPQSGSWENEVESEFIGTYILDKVFNSKRYSLLQNIGIISPYKPQAKLIRQIWNNMLGPKEDRDRCLIGTSDSFQGNERDIIILSLTNNNIYQNDFINDSKRVNVSLTRCKKCLIVVTSFDYKSVLRQQSVWAHWFKHFDSSCLFN
eukprot:274636_1